jgi:acetyl-CoA carboxylase alpha subunit
MAAAVTIVKDIIIKELAILNKMDPQERIMSRIEKFGKMGVVVE